MFFFLRKKCANVELNIKIAYVHLDSRQNG